MKPWSYKIMLELLMSNLFLTPFEALGNKDLHLINILCLIYLTATYHAEQQIQNYKKRIIYIGTIYLHLKRCQSK